MSYTKRILLVGDTPKVKEFASVLSASASVFVTPTSKTALAEAQKIAADGIVFIVPVYWENIFPFIEELKKDPSLAQKPVIYVGDFIEANDQSMLKRVGVHTITLGPVPNQEIARYILSLV